MNSGLPQARGVGIAKAAGLALVFLTMVMAGSYGILVDEASAARKYKCDVEGDGWVCYWEDSDLQPETRHWFNASNTLRNWTFAGVWDWTNSVAKKCVKIKRSSDGDISNVACTHNGGNPDAWIGSGRRPGWLFNIHWAPGPRYIGSTAFH
jgi:hypothetical protein